jgi:hypothetical protein
MEASEVDDTIFITYCPASDELPQVPTEEELEILEDGRLNCLAHLFRFVFCNYFF